ncbi:hypothetical protein [Amycolatopsis mediterranei]|uniref:hypothetical protein n=1 Tax=Amycolatopsis mediterranei TaxID=33910 RepID=UPI00038DC9B5|nr:hypothetical protein [Amycolatopsis mediterranei]AGT87897.1 hypothetical protein B737_7236 [Amycolatopsis mediterranei RB]
MARRSTGTQTPFDRLLHLSRPRTPERDLADFEAGETIQVLCLVWTLGGARNYELSGRKLALAKPGHLYLTKGAPVEWRRAGASDALTKYLLWAMSTLGLVRHQGKRVPLPKPGDSFEDKTWAESRGEGSVIIPAQSNWVRAARKLRGPKRKAFTVRTADGEHDIAVPAADVPLVRHALS